MSHRYPAEVIPFPRRPVPTGGEGVGMGQGCPPSGGWPPEAEAVVLEEDTARILNDTGEVCAVQDHPIRIMTALYDDPGLVPGSVWVAAGTPLRLHAVVHDFDYEPSWREDWILAALEEVRRVVVRRRILALAIPLLGAIHGRIAEERAKELVLAHFSPGRDGLKRLWLGLPGAYRRGHGRPLIWVETRDRASEPPRATVLPLRARQPQRVPAPGAARPEPGEGRTALPATATATATTPPHPSVPPAGTEAPAS
jgi:hypothetical protein